MFVHKIVDFPYSPPGLKNLLKDKSCRHTYNMRATDRFIVPKMNTSFGDATFINFFEVWTVGVFLSIDFSLSVFQFVNSHVKGC